MYKIILKKNQYATVKLNGKEIECLSGLFVTTADLAELDKLVRLANSGAAEQKRGADSPYADEFSRKVTFPDGMGW